MTPAAPADLLTPLTPRHHSVSSSPAAGPRHADLMNSPPEAPAGLGRGAYRGAITLAGLRPGEPL
ncbi:hypothetical protein AB0D38_36125 [Streptomyces sp. NPDC048279]|uniref:hypothetical protein n=1 Tax=Streptomyces sp. NPDC048279 TaxID=3154714 RepID=UPI0034169854